MKTWMKSLIKKGALYSVSLKMNSLLCIFEDVSQYFYSLQVYGDFPARDLLSVYKTTKQLT